MKSLEIAIISVGMLLLMANIAQAADKKELQARFEHRYPQILEYKTQGKVGETTRGVLELVDSKSSDATLTKLIEDENSDRRELYRIIAEEEKVTPEKVAERTARRNYEKARPGEYLKTADGQWRKKS